MLLINAKSIRDGSGPRPQEIPHGAESMYRWERMRLISAFVLAFGCALSSLAFSVSGEEYMRRGASVEDFEQALGRVLDRRRGARTYHRKIKETWQARVVAPARTQPSQRTGVVVPGVAPADADGPRSDDRSGSDGVAIYFGPDSARLSGEATAQLRKLAQALAKPQFTDIQWLIEGHTDAMGPSEYNQTLSERRAQSAHRYLVTECGIDPRRLTAVGRGESAPYDRRNPGASANRRVRIRPAD